MPSQRRFRRTDRPLTTHSEENTMRALKVLSLLLIIAILAVTANAQTTTHNIKTVFIILMENHNWTGGKKSQNIKGNPDAPYINNTLLPMASHAEQYFNPPGIHPSLPNYLWLEAGTNFGIRSDDDPSTNQQSTTAHLVTLLKNAGISWRAYEEDTTGSSCPLTDVDQYAVGHDPFVYFDDVTDHVSASSQYCIEHIRPFTQLASDLQANNIGRYNFITPNKCDDMHDCSIAAGDTWLANNLP